MITRTLSSRLLQLAPSYPVIFLTGPRQSGKTTLARSAFPDYMYVSLEDLQNREEATEDPRGFLRRLENAPGAILDEVQRTPDLFSYIQGFVDSGGGPLILTGSEQFLLSERIDQTLAGRAAILELLPFSVAELCRRASLSPDEFIAGSSIPSGEPPMSLDNMLFTGFFPRIHDLSLEPSPWLDGYIRTYVERDVRALTAVGDLDTFGRFVALCAGRSGQLLNTSSLGADAGVTHSTARRWISILKAGYVIDLLQPHFENFSRRLVKAPKLYFVDTGLLCRLLGVRSPGDLHRHPLRGLIVENLVIGELRKLFLHHGQRPPLYFWRDSNGREVDVIIDLGIRRIPVEIKAGLTVAADFLKSLDLYAGLSQGEGGILVYGGDETYRRRQDLVRAWWSCT
ncbi:ATP-binding protein [Candidatus Fermentibacteria bacterium]|nr:ATP-binding protein [Candidatus Fermentibacteria bacterium]